MGRGKVRGSVFFLRWEEFGGFFDALRRYDVRVLVRALAPFVFLVAWTCACRRKAGDPGRAEDHDPRVAPLTAAVQAEPGKTPCDSAYNAYVALERAALAAGLAPPWERLPKREAFSETCLRLKAEQQHCLVPKHQSDRARCEPVLAELSADPWGKAILAMLKPPAGVGGVAPGPSGGVAPISSGGVAPISSGGAASGKP